MLAMEEAKAPPGTRSINSYLLDRMGGSRSLESIKGIHKREAYRTRIAEYREHLLVGALDGVLEASAGVLPVDGRYSG